MASKYSPLLLFLFFFFFFFLISILSQNNNNLPIDPIEEKALYQILNSLNPTLPPLAYTAVCEYFPSQQQAHIVELKFGFLPSVSEDHNHKQTHFCSSNSTLNFTSFTYLRKILFYKCFNNTQQQNPLLFTFPSSLQELVFIDNPSTIFPFLHNNLTSLTRLVFIGNGFTGQLPSQIFDLHNLEELTISRNNLSGDVPASLGMLKKLKILDLSHNVFEGCVPEQVGNLTSLLKLDLSYNGFGCNIPESFVFLKNLEVLDLSFNGFRNFGIPVFLGEISKLKEVYLSGNLLSGEIPEIWENLGGVEKIGFSKMGLIGKIPISMGVYLKNLTYLGLDNNNLDGPVPKEFGVLKFVDEINLENNNLSGRITFSYEVAKKFKFAGNVGLCLGLGRKYRCYLSYEGSSSLCQLNRCEIPTGYHIHSMMIIVMILLLSYYWFCSTFLHYDRNMN